MTPDFPPMLHSSRQPGKRDRTACCQAHRRTVRQGRIVGNRSPLSTSERPQFEHDPQGCGEHRRRHQRPQPGVSTHQSGESAEWKREFRIADTHGTRRHHVRQEMDSGEQHRSHRGRPHRACHRRVEHHDCVAGQRETVGQPAHGQVDSRDRDAPPHHGETGKQLHHRGIQSADHNPACCDGTLWHTTESHYWSITVSSQPTVDDRPSTDTTDYPSACQDHERPHGFELGVWRTPAADHESSCGLPRHCEQS